MPVLFAVTLFASATLLFMVQPMVGKMVLPLLGGSPAAWNTCMVFFQALLLLGYLYADRLTARFAPGPQAKWHLGVLAGVGGWFALAAVLAPAHTPVPIFRSLAPQGEAYPMFGVLALLGAAIGLPFLVVSTSAPLLQRWFAETGHPAAKDPYFLYAASNAGSLISLLGYPLFLEPLLSLAEQAWVFAGGFGVLTVLVFLCGRAVATSPYPRPAWTPGPDLGVLTGLGLGAAGTPDPLAPKLARKLKWLGLAFVPSSLMLGVTFHMTTDIASVPLLWVIPLALYLITFIIAFAHTPGWFRPVLGNVSPVVTLLLVFVLTTDVKEKLTTFVGLGLHLVAYFFTALLMHSELARDRPDPKYLTGYFLWISLGGVAGGIFNALIAPVCFVSAWEYPIAIAVGCMLVPVLYEDPPADAEPDPDAPKPGVWAEAWKKFAVGFDVLIPFAMLAFVAGLTALPRQPWFQTAVEWVAKNLTAALAATGSEVAGSNPMTVVLGFGLPPCTLYFLFIDRTRRFGLSAAAVLFATSFLAGEWIKKNLTVVLGFTVTGPTIVILVCGALPCMLCFLFIDRPRRFGLCVAAVLFVTYFQAARTANTEATARSFFGILKVEKLVDSRMIAVVVPNEVTETNKPFFLPAYDSYHRLLHGTTLHGTQAVERFGLTQPHSEPKFWEGYPMSRSSTTAWLCESVMRDDLRMLGGQTGWDAVLLAGAQNAWDARQEPLTYYHRTGPVGEVFREFRKKTPRGDFAMIGLGTGSVACYARPGQKLTFYEIDPTVISLVVDSDKYFTYVSDARKRGAEVDFVLGDARLKLDEKKDAKYGLLLVDAFSSDSIPVHLLTLEAMRLYKDRVTEDGLIAVHISNRYIDLEPVVARLAEETKLVGRVFSDDYEQCPGKTRSSWIVLAKSDAALGDFAVEAADTGFGGLVGGAGWTTFRPDRAWKPLKTDENVPAWTDDFSDVLRVMRLPEIRKLRKALGLPVANESKDD